MKVSRLTFVKDDYIIILCIPEAKVEEVTVKKNVRKKDVEYDIGHVQTQTKDVAVTIFSV